MIEQRETTSAGQRIANLRQFFRSRRGDGQAGATGDGSGFEPTLWPETEWSDTCFDPFGENS